MQTFEVSLDELGVSQLYLNQRKLEAVRERAAAEDFAGFEPLPVYDFFLGRFGIIAQGMIFVEVFF